MASAADDVGGVKREVDALPSGMAPDAEAREDAGASALVPECWALLNQSLLNQSLLGQSLAPRARWTRRLVITKQPASEFYKDEGGKANALEVEVTLVEFDEHGEPARSPDSEFIDIPLRILLFFESGKRVDDADQDIFRFVGNEYDSVVIRAATRKASVQFRLEKVSRRKDGQRFKLRIEVDQEQCTANVADLTPIFTNAICVLSKRKHHHHSAISSDASLRGKEPPPKIMKRDLAKLEERLGDKMDRVLAELGRMQRHIAKQNELISKHLVAVPVGMSATPDSAVLDWFLKSSGAEEYAPLPSTTVLYANASMQYFDVPCEHENEGDASGFSASPSASPSASSSAGTDGSRLPLPFPQI